MKEIEEKISVYAQTEDYKITVQEADGWIILHLDVYKWSPSALKHGRKLFGTMLKEYAELGHELVFSSTLSPQTVKFCKMLHPVYEVKEDTYYDQPYWVVAWETGLDL
jgi:hypothetical protein